MVLITPPTTTQAGVYLDSGWLLAADYFKYAVIVVGIIGTAANSLIIYALIVHNARETKKRVVNWLIINQNLLDFCCCIIVVVSCSIIVSNIYLTGALGNILCKVFISGSAHYCLLNASVINLMGITIERYLKVVYPFWSKKNLKNWMIYAAIAFSWIAGILSVGPLGIVTSVVADGACLDFQLYFESLEMKNAYGAWNLFSFFFLPLIVFVYCYGHIVAVMRKQARVMAGHNVEGSAQSSSQAQSKRVKWNIIKTMIIVSVFFGACYFPLNVWIMVVENPQHPFELAITFLFTTLPYINISLNPFIYAIKHEGVRRILSRVIICRKRNDVAAVIDTSADNRNAGRRSTTTRSLAVAARPREASCH